MNITRIYPRGWGRPTTPAPVFDGAFSPNQRADLAALVDRNLPGVDDVVVTALGEILVSRGHQIVRITGQGPAALQSVLYELEGPAGGLCLCPDGGLLVCVAGVGVLGLGGALNGLRIEQADGRPLHCATSVALARDGRVLITEGSAQHLPHEWDVDWAKRGNSGRIIVVDPRTGATTTLASGLRYPHGIAQRASDGALVVAESWACAMLVLPPAGDSWSQPRPGATWLPGYPARIVPSRQGGFWVSFLSARTQLLDFVLQEERLLRRMVAEVPRPYWISPSLAASDDVGEPLQLGGIKLGGVGTAWAPGRSYGLLARFNDELEAVESFHSRADGRRHGITGLREGGNGLYFVSKGHGKLMVHEAEESHE